MNTPSPQTLEEKTKTPSGPVVVPSDVEADRQAMLALWQRNLPDATASRYDWLYASGRTRSWIARNENQEVVGSIGLMDRHMNLLGEDHPCGQAIDLNVDRRYRIGQLALRLQRAVADNVNQGRLSLVYGLPNPQSEAVARRSGYEVVGPVTRWARALRTFGYVEDRLPSRTLAKIAAGTLDAALWLRWPESRYHRRAEHRVEITDTFDERFDQLWQRAAHQFPIIGQRTADYLNWRFRDAPGAVYRTLCLSDRSDRLLAYLVYTVRDDVAYVADFLHADDHVANAVLAEFIKLMRVQRAKAIVTIFSGAGTVARRLARFGFRRRPSSWKIMIHSDAVRLGIPRYKLLDVGNWYLTRADIDTEF